MSKYFIPSKPEVPLQEWAFNIYLCYSWLAIFGLVFLQQENPSENEICQVIFYNYQIQSAVTHDHLNQAI